MAKLIGDRISTEEHSDATTIIVFPQRKRFREWLLTFWVTGFTFIGFVMIYLLIGGINGLSVSDGQDIEEVRDQQKIYLIVFIGFWIYFEYKTVKALLWYKFGKELIRISREGMSVKRSIFSYGKSHLYFYENVKQMKVAEVDNTSFSQFFENAYWTVGTDSVTFQHFGKTKSFGRRLDPKDANQLIRYIVQKSKKWKKSK